MCFFGGSKSSQRRSFKNLQRHSRYDGKTLAEHTRYTSFLPGASTSPRSCLLILSSFLLLGSNLGVNRFRSMLGASGPSEGMPNGDTECKARRKSLMLAVRR